MLPAITKFKLSQIFTKINISIRIKFLFNAKYKIKLVNHNHIYTLVITLNKTCHENSSIIYNKQNHCFYQFTSEIHEKCKTVSTDTKNFIIIEIVIFCVNIHISTKLYLHTYVFIHNYMLSSIFLHNCCICYILCIIFPTESFGTNC